MGVLVLVVTYCSRDKDHSAGMLPALDRYFSERIRSAHRTAKEISADFRILSGLYGLVAPDQEIPDYDHLLTAEQVSDHAEKVISQLRGLEPARVIFVTRPLSVDPGAGPYRKVMEMACAAWEASFEVVEI